MLPCGHETHTDELFHGTLFPECIKAQAELEHKAAAYDALVKACKLALLDFKMINSVQGQGMWRGHPFTITPSFLTEAIEAAEPVSKTQSETLSVAEGSEVEGKEP